MLSKFIADAALENIRSQISSCSKSLCLKINQIGNTEKTIYALHARWAYKCETNKQTISICHKRIKKNKSI